LTLADRPVLAAEIVRIRTAVQPHQLMYIDIYRRTEMPGYEHKTLLSALSTRNTALIEMCLREHVLSAGRGVVSFLAMHHPQHGDAGRMAGGDRITALAALAKGAVDR
jgi:DNA-binding GntR family transcriptional regulator